MQAAPARPGTALTVSQADERKRKNDTPTARNRIRTNTSETILRNKIPPAPVEVGLELGAERVDASGGLAARSRPRYGRRYRGRAATPETAGRPARHASRGDGCDNR